jgi:hypothetical protein
VIRRAITALVLAAAIAAPAFGSSPFPLIGTYVRDRKCERTGPVHASLWVRIKKHRIESSMGLCKILNWHRDGQRIMAHLECAVPGGPTLLGDVTFTIRNETTLDFQDQDHTSDATLYKCNR